MNAPKQFGRTSVIPFAIGNLKLEAAPEVSAKVMLNMANLRGEMGEDVSNEKKINTMSTIFKKILSDADYKALMAGLQSEKVPGDEEGADPIGIHTLIEVVEWLFGEVYGGRPTQKPQS